MGRDTKSSAEKKASGNPGNRKIPTETDVDVIVNPRAPAGMDRAQKKYWKRYAKPMINAGMLTELNVGDLVRLCKFEAALDSMLDFMADNVGSMVQEKKNYHGDVVDLVESTYSKIARNYAATIRHLKADLKLRTDKMGGTFKPKEKPIKNEFEGF
jgi:hypothetical protein